MGFSALDLWASELGIAVSVVSESQSSDYESGLAQIDGFEWHVRTARNTPSKPGAFVAFWRRDIEGQSQPFSDDSMNSGLLVFVRNHAQRGVFRFSADHLAELGITAVGSQPGKRGFRVYPAWCEGLNPHAKAMQRAQSSAFEEY